ncbi:hypothetical protein [Catenuloplanes sp. NPDC020197]|uniref:hypothetical protein n=1 Tax=Catenuloplanes sp. NPDC020197 TaxID=3363958 RepID=UPI0037A9AF14
MENAGHEITFVEHALANGSDLLVLHHLAKPVLEVLAPQRTGEDDVVGLPAEAGPALLACLKPAT